MKKILLPLAALLVVSLGCSCTSMKPNARTNYVAPSSNVLGSHITNAQARTTSARAHATKTSAALAAAAAKAKTAKERILVIEKAVEKTPPILTLAKQVEGDIDDLTKLLLDANTSNDSLKVDLNSTAQALSDAVVAKASLQKQIDDQTVLLNQANVERNAAITQGAVDKRNAHKFKWIIIGLAVGAAGLVVFAIFGALSFAPPLLYLMIGAPAAVGTFLFFWLGSG
jgi:hypothetical protein